jgi:hypothetical protein
MNAFKRSDKPTHKLYSSSSARKEFVTNKEFALDLSVDSVDLKASFSDLQNSFFSKDSSQVDKEILDNLKIVDNPALNAQKSKSLALPEDKLIVFKKNKEEETNYTAKPVFGSLKLERDEFKKNWLCQNCIII